MGAQAAPVVPIRPQMYQYTSLKTCTHYVVGYNVIH